LPCCQKRHRANCTDGGLALISRTTHSVTDVPVQCGGAENDGHENAVHEND